MKWNFIFALLVGFAFFFVNEALGQCAMCKATIEANQVNQGKYGVSLNSGILYLMVVPYIAFLVLGYFWYKNAKARKVVQSHKS